MATKKDKPEKPDKSKKAETKAATKEAAVAAAEAIKPLKVEINFPSIADLKQAIQMDSDGKLVMAIQFKAPVDQYEIFRLVNLLKQPHGALYATIGTPQSAMDFKFSREGKVEILKAEHAKPLPAPQGKPVDLKDDNGVVVFEDVTFNHIPEEDRPFGCTIDFTNGSDKIHCVAGRGKTAAEAVIAGVKQTSPKLFGTLNQPFAVVEAVKNTKETPARTKIIRAIEVGSFDIGEDKGEKPNKGD